MNVLQASTARIYPTAAQSRTMVRIGGQCRALWNHWLAVSRDRYEAEGKFAFYKEMSAALPILRKEEKFQGLPHRCAQMTVMKLDRALRDCGKKIKNRKGFPKFKKYDDRRDSFQFVGREVSLAPGKIRLPALGWLRIRGLRVPDESRLIQVTVRQNRGGWSLSLQFESPAPVYAQPTLPTVGIDVGLTTWAALSSGPPIAPPRYSRYHAARLRRLEREKSRRRKGSVNRRRTVARLTREHARLASRRLDFSHKRSRELIDLHEGVSVETLRLNGLMRTRLAKSFGDAALGEFVRQLRYKAEWAGRNFNRYPTFQRSTGVCPDCGAVGEKLPLNIRVWRCEGCGAQHERDHAAAQVILLGAVPEVIREPAAVIPRKRGFAATVGPRARARSSPCGPPPNVAHFVSAENPCE